MDKNWNQNSQNAQQTKLKILMAKILYKLGVVSLMRNFQKKSEIIILMFHQIEKNNFEEQIKYLKKYYNLISMEDAVNMLNCEKRIIDNSVAITFDDGYKNSLIDAYPILKKYKVPATLFLISDLINENKLAWWDHAELFYGNQSKIQSMKNIPNEKRKNMLKTMILQIKDIPEKYKFLSKNELRKMSDFFSYGSHTLNHPILTMTKKDEAKIEIMNSKKKLENLLNMKIKSFCYPNGDFNDEIKNIVKDAGYDNACSTEKGGNKQGCDLFELKRIGVDITHSKEIMAMKIIIRKPLSHLMHPLSRTDGVMNNL